MADRPAGGAGGLAGDAAKDDSGAVVNKVSAEDGSAAQQDKTGRDTEVERGSSSRHRQTHSKSDRGVSADSSTKSTASKGQAPARPVLGAGGTSAAAEQPGTGAGPDQDSGPGGGEPGDKSLSGAKMAGATAAVPAAGAAGQVMVIAMFINWLKGLAMALAAMAANLMNLLVGMALTVLKTAVGAVMGIGGVVSGAIGGAVSAAVAGATTVVGGGLVGTMLVVGTVVSVNTGNEIARHDGGAQSQTCVDNATVALEQVEGAEQHVAGQSLENAKLVYGVLSAWGMPAENIAGIIGNWDAESGVDPTSVQSHFASPQQMSDVKRAAALHTINGIGLGQWTGVRNKNLRDYAAGHGKDWWILEVQLGFMISAAEASDANIVKDMMVNSKGSPAQAALYFHDKWERSADTASMAARRGTMANKWMGMFSSWEKNTALADSILTQSGTTVGAANTERAETVRAGCLGVGEAELVMAEGGLNQEQAQALIDLYRSEGEQFLRSRFGAGGPGDCGYGKADNCVGFSTYFANKYTSFQQYAPGNGIQTAHSMARMMGKKVSRTPTPYSIASGPGISPAGHTFVVLGIQGDHAVIGEASCGSNHTGTIVELIPLSELTDGIWSFVDVSDLMVEEPFEL